MARRKVDLGALQGLVQGAENQVVASGNRKTEDPNFPVFSTPINEDILVYIPRTNVITTENGEEMQVLKTHIHDYKNGKQYGQLRCISNLSGGVFDALNYDGVCPACEATKESWDLFNIKMEAEAEKRGIDIQNDAADVLKPFRDTFRDEMQMRKAEEYVTFPIVIVPLEGKMKPSADALENLKPVFVTWRKKRYDDNIVSALEGILDGPSHPAGMFWNWKFTYDVPQGKSPSARDSAKNAKYLVLETGVQKFGKELVDACEKAAEEFTLVKATEVIIANQFLYKEDLQDEVNKIMQQTRQKIELSKVGGATQATIGGQTTPQLQLGEGGNPLDNFGMDNSIGLE